MNNGANQGTSTLSNIKGFSGELFYVVKYYIATVNHILDTYLITRGNAQYVTRKTA